MAVNPEECRWFAMFNQRDATPNQRTTNRQQAQCAAVRRADTCLVKAAHPVRLPETDLPGASRPWPPGTF
jgi:hypothetical protein